MRGCASNACRNAAPAASLLTELQLRDRLPQRPTGLWFAIVETLCVTHAFQGFLISAELEENAPPGRMGEDVTGIELDCALKLAQRGRGVVLEVVQYAQVVADRVVVHISCQGFT